MLVGETVEIHVRQIFTKLDLPRTAEQHRPVRSPQLSRVPQFPRAGGSSGACRAVQCRP